MPGQNRVLSILKDKSGASLMFVLGIMLFLMAIGVSALVAASANAGFALRQKEYSQIRILDESIHNNIMYSLQHAPGNEDFLSYQLVMALFEARDSGSNLEDIELTISIGGHDLRDENGGSIKVERVTLSFPEQSVVIRPSTPAIPPIPEMPEEVDPGTGLPIPGTGSPGIPGVPRTPMTATVNARMAVTVELSARGRHVTSRSIYEYTGGRLSDDPSGVYIWEEPPDSHPMGFESGGHGRWEMISYENVG
jgi:hypothetical protein